jgi:hypothetical protein
LAECQVVHKNGIYKHFLVLRHNFLVVHRVHFFLNVSFISIVVKKATPKMGHITFLCHWTLKGLPYQHMLVPSLPTPRSYRLSCSTGKPRLPLNSRHCTAYCTCSLPVPGIMPTEI